MKTKFLTREVPQGAKPRVRKQLRIEDHVRRILLSLDTQQRLNLTQQSKVSPLEFLVNVLNDQDVRLVLRIDAAKAAAPYLHRKMPIAIEGGDPNRPITLAPALVASMSKEDLLALNALLQRIQQQRATRQLVEGVAVREAESDEEESPDIQA